METSNNCSQETRLELLLLGVVLTAHGRRYVSLRRRTRRDVHSDTGSTRRDGSKRSSVSQTASAMDLHFSYAPVPTRSPTLPTCAKGGSCTEVPTNVCKDLGLVTKV